MILSSSQRYPLTHKIRIIDGPEAARSSLSEVDWIWGSGTLYPVGVASGKLQLPFQGVITCPGGSAGYRYHHQNYRYQIERGFELVADQEEHGGEGGEG